MEEHVGRIADEELFTRLVGLVCECGEASYAEVRAGFAACIDQTLLDPTLGPEQVADWARAQAFQGFATLCVQPCNAGRVAWELGRLQSPTGAGTVLAFPQGQSLPEALCFEVAMLAQAGVAEFDLAMNCGAFFEGSYEEVAAPILSVLGTLDADVEEEGECCGEDGCDCGCGKHHHHDEDAGDEDAHDEPPLLKVVLETALLSDEQVCAATDLVSSLGADFVSAATGFGARGASVHDVQLMCATVEPGVRVKAAGDIRCLAEAVELLEAGATRLGTPCGDVLLDELDSLAVRLGYLSGTAGR